VHVYWLAAFGDVYFQNNMWTIDLCTWLQQGVGVYRIVQVAAGNVARECNILLISSWLILMRLHNCSAVNDGDT
jgi:hypothetical protein